MTRSVPFLCLLLASVCSAETEWRTFENSDRTKSFRGRLVGYEPELNLVTVQKKSSLRPVRFKLELLSPENQEFVKARAVELEAASGLRMMFYETIEKVDGARTADTRTNNYNGGFRIEIRNFARKKIEDVTVDYIVIYRKDSTSGLGDLATKSGSQKISTLIPNLDERIVADGIPLKSYYKAGSVSVSGGST